MHDLTRPRITFDESSPDIPKDTCQCYALRALNPKNGPEPDQLFPSNFTAALLAPLDLLDHLTIATGLLGLSSKQPQFIALQISQPDPQCLRSLHYPSASPSSTTDCFFLSIPFFSFPFHFHFPLQFLLNLSLTFVKSPTRHCSSS